MSFNFICGAAYLKSGRQGDLKVCLTDKEGDKESVACGVYTLSMKQLLPEIPCQRFQQICQANRLIKPTVLGLKQQVIRADTLL